MGLSEIGFLRFAAVFFRTPVAAQCSCFLTMILPVSWAAMDPRSVHLCHTLRSFRRVKIRFCQFFRGRAALGRVAVRNRTLSVSDAVLAAAQGVAGASTVR